MTCAILAMGPLVGGCSMSFPMASMVPAADEVTGSTSKVPFGALLDEEDRRREKAALATALDPQGNGSSVHWENPTSGNKGSLTPVGHAYPIDAKICRSFTGTLKTADTTKNVEGTACSATAGEWIAKDLRSTPKS